MRKTLLLLAISLLAVQTVFAQEKVKRNQYGVAVKSDRLARLTEQFSSVRTRTMTTLETE